MEPREPSKPAANHTGNVYSTAPIDRDTDSIRLLRIPQRATTDAIDCDLLSFAGKDVPVYSALSYTWGGADVQRPIRVNGITVMVRENLYQFLLQQFRATRTQNVSDVDQESAGFRFFWIDALCIDQSNVDERNHQVQLMKNIYLKASLVHVWLGVTSLEDESGRAVRLLEDLHKYRWSPEFDLGRKYWTSSETRCVLQLCSRRYWSRIWIVQEIMLGKKLTVSYGASTFNWMWLDTLSSCLFLSKLQVHPESDIRHYDRLLISPAMNFIRLRPQLRKLSRASDGGSALHRLVTTFEHMEASNPVDMIYGLLGLCEHLEPDRVQRITADYQKSAGDIFKDALLFFMASRELRLADYVTYLDVQLTVTLILILKLSIETALDAIREICTITDVIAGHIQSKLVKRQIEQRERQQLDVDL